MITHWVMTKAGRSAWVAHYPHVRDDAVADGWTATEVTEQVREV